MGCIYGKREHLMRFRPYKVRPAPDSLPDRWETGTQTHECIAGVAAAVEYLADLGRRTLTAERTSANPTRRHAIVAGYHAIRDYEISLAAKMIRGLLEIPGLRFYGIADPARFDERVPTVGVRFAGKTPLEAATSSASAASSPGTEITTR